MSERDWIWTCDIAPKKYLSTIIVILFQTQSPQKMCMKTNTRTSSSINREKPSNLSWVQTSNVDPWKSTKILQFN